MRAARGVPHIDGVHHDNTDESPDEAFYRLLFEKAPDPMVLVDGERQLVEANRSARDLDVDVTGLFSDERTRRFFSTLRAFGHAATEIHIVDRAGHGRVIALRGRTVTQTRYAIALQDVTSRRELEGELARMRRLESLGLITASVVHDLNNMLTPILCLSAMLSTDLDPSSTSARQARDVRSAAERAAGLVRQVLSFVRRDPNRVSHTDPSSVLFELRHLVEHVAGEEIEVVLALDESAGQVMVDREQLEQVVLNLAANARDAMPDGGRLTLATAVANLGDAEAHVIECPGPGTYVAVRISDTGVGMPSEIRERVFDVLFTTKPYGGGNGLGLATAHRFARQNGGCIALDSTPGRGTTVTIYIPCTTEAKLSLSRSPETPLPRGSETVLIVDDDEGVLATAQAVLMSQGYRVLAARSGHEALGLLKAEARAIDLVLTDVVMPGMSGRALADAVTRPGDRPKVLFMSGHPDDKVRVQGVRCPDDLVLRKAFAPKELLRKVRQALDSKS
jgi:signal transduction histidine kinase/CheY-like chemotaxis protein